MDKIYLLLRNNKQTGPHTSDELRQLGLRPTDLLWVEGKSCCWSHPAELEALRLLPFTEEKPGTTPQKVNANAETAPAYSPSITQAALTKDAASRKYVYVSLPTISVPPTPAGAVNAAEQTLEQKAEELLRRAQAYASEHKEKEKVWNREIPPAMGFTKAAIPEEKKKAQRPQRSVGKGLRLIKKRNVAFLAGVLLCGAGYVLAKGWINTEKTGGVSQSARQTLQQESTTAAKKESPANNRVPDATENTSLPVETESAEIKTPNTKPTTVQSKKKDTLAARRVRAIELAPNDAPSEEKSPLLREAEVPVNLGITTTEPAPSSAGTQKENKLGKKINKLFKSFKYEPTEQKSANAGPADLSGIADVSVTTVNNPADGGRQMNVTLRNRTGETIKIAVLELRYFNDRNALIEKKILHFRNVPANGSATLAAPGYAAADHTYYRLVSAER